MENDIQNKVVPENIRYSGDFYKSDLILQSYIDNHFSKDTIKRIKPFLSYTGKKAAQEMDQLSMDADKYSPQLKRRDFFGNDIDEVNFHPSYGKLLDIAVNSGMFSLKWGDNDHKVEKEERHKAGFSSGYLYAMSELGQYCPLCMTDGVARLIDLHMTEDEKSRLLPQIGTTETEHLITGAMFLTEKSGGSDVGRNIVKAKHIKDDIYELYGEKWFCSNVNAELIFALARTDDQVSGTKGLSIFLIEKQKKDGGQNPLPIRRLKDKLGVRSMASAECILNGTEAKRVGEEFKGFKVMTDMINLSRLYNAVAALSGSRRALIEAYTFNTFRTSFGQKAINHALIRDKFWELGALHVAGFYLTWKTIDSLDQADQGDESARQLNRILTPMTKKWTAEKGVYITRESMELMGGIGYIEDGVMPKIMRDIMVLPIWEGAGNIMTLDMLRASFKSKGLTVMIENIQLIAKENYAHGSFLNENVNRIKQEVEQLKSPNREEVELKAKYLFESLTSVFQYALLVDELDKQNEAWIIPSLDYLQLTIEKKEPSRCLTKKEIDGLIAWDIG